MYDVKYWGKTKEEWQKRDEEITRDLTRMGAYKPETRPIVPKLTFSEAAILPMERTFATEFYSLTGNALRSQDKILESAKILPASHAGFLHHGIAAHLMQRSANSLREAISRDLVESSTLDYFPTKFRMAAFLISRGVRDPGGEGSSIFPESYFSWADFKSNQAKADRMISSAKDMFFVKNKFIDKKLAPLVWKRFDTAWKKLSRKQKSALKIYVMTNEPMSLERAANRLKISKSSFRDRVDSAMKQIRAALPELEGLHIHAVKIKPKRKAKPKIFYPAKNAPSRTRLNEWLEKTTHEPRWSEWSVIFRPPKVPKEIKEL